MILFFGQKIVWSFSEIGRDDFRRELKARVRLCVCVV